MSLIRNIIVRKKKQCILIKLKILIINIFFFNAFNWTGQFVQAHFFHGGQVRGPKIGPFPHVILLAAHLTGPFVGQWEAQLYDPTR